ncbi:Crp/Fnr family transcriptional regulator [Arcticibacter tournemirensis]|uniref:Crp/Fnr family transcriptional regulator n=1 Tax=Arcticibacter tournemirensis TaxID=699437 RepID=A0A4Q0M8B8_9SPHI|nr:Crp/Fnr family transcriptional regulator [Arcticibacter tournemirensis]RXF69381.1 Crp/Fnr family transcriptional regulator [Arcticibacter tournemirensis]
MKQVIQKALSAYFPVSLQAAEALCDSARLTLFNEDDFLEQESEQVNSEFIVLDGIVRGFITNSRGEDITINFYTNGGAVTPAIMRGMNHRSIYNLQIVSRTARVLVFSNVRMESVMPKYKDLEMFGNTVLMADSQRRVEREMILLKETAENKLIWFRKAFPGLENKVPHYYIASYLGITATSLSRVRRKV